MENLCSSFFSFTGLAGVGGGVITVTLSCPCPSPRQVLTLKKHRISHQNVAERLQKRPMSW